MRTDATPLYVAHRLGPAHPLGLARTGDRDRLAPDSGGLGPRYVTEAARSALRYALNTLRMQQVVADIDPQIGRRRAQARLAASGRGAVYWKHGHPVRRRSQPDCQTLVAAGLGERPLHKLVVPALWC